MRAVFFCTCLVALAFAGCLSPDPPNESPPQQTPPAAPPIIVTPSPYSIPMSFTARAIPEAVSYVNDLYEPTIDVSDTGIIYVSGHTILVDTTGAPVFVSRDDGITWEQPPFFNTVYTPEPLPGATPPPSDEIFVVAGSDGYAYGVDITGATFPINAWRDDGREHIYHNPNAYDRVASTGAGVCSVASLNDRPWAAYSNNTLLLVNNPGGGPMQIGVLTTPLNGPLGAPGNPVLGPEWNTCASSGGFIPGIPDLRPDGFFAVPQLEQGRLHVVVGNADNIFDVQQFDIMAVQNYGSGTTNYGHAVFDSAGDLFVAARTNPNPEAASTGQVSIAYSADGVTFDITQLNFTSPVSSIYLDGNKQGAGALFTWAQNDVNGTDWYAGHLQYTTQGLRLTSVSLVVNDGPPPSAHVQGAALGPDGRAYLVMFYPTQPLGEPLVVMVQDSGPILT